MQANDILENCRGYGLFPSDINDAEQKLKGAIKNLPKDEPSRQNILGDLNSYLKDIEKWKDEKSKIDDEEKKWEGISTSDFMIAPFTVYLVKPGTESESMGKPENRLKLVYVDAPAHRYVTDDYVETVRCCFVLQSRQNGVKSYCDEVNNTMKNAVIRLRERIKLGEITANQATPLLKREYDRILAESY